MGRIVFLFLALAMLNSPEASSQVSLKPEPDTIVRKILSKPLPQNFYKQELGFFCKKELQLQRLTSVPLFIRLGSKEYVDYLERKPNAVKKN